MISEKKDLVLGSSGSSNTAWRTEVEGKGKGEGRVMEKKMKRDRGGEGRVKDWTRSGMYQGSQ